MEKKTLPLFPRAWYVVAFSTQLKKGQILSRTVAGEAIIIFRTQKGEVAVTEAYCPHMGAHLGCGGIVEGETVICPFHRFVFSTDGQCIRTGYELAVPKMAKLKVFKSVEKNGFIYVWHGNDAPTWQIPDISSEGWSKLKTHSWILNSHPQEIAENSADVGHFAVVHGYKNVEIVDPPYTEKERLYINYAFDREIASWLKKAKLRVVINGTVFGMGFSFVETRIETLGIYTRHYVMPTPTEEGKVLLQVATSVKLLKGGWKLINPLFLRLAMSGYLTDIQKDFFIWEHKTYIERPILAQGDGPIMFYRNWAKQFYVSGNE